VGAAGDGWRDGMAGDGRRVGIERVYCSVGRRALGAPLFWSESKRVYCSVGAAGVVSFLGGRDTQMGPEVRPDAPLNPGVRVLGASFVNFIHLFFFKHQLLLNFAVHIRLFTNLDTVSLDKVCPITATVLLNFAIHIGS
jgi:hypothetical protein